MEESEDLKIKFKRTKNLNKELSILMDDVIEDIVHRNVDVEISYISIELESNIKDIFSKESSWILSLSVNWSKFVADKFTKGIIGLFADIGYLYKAQTLFEDIILNKIANNKDFVSFLKKIVENELNQKFDSNFEMYGISQCGFSPLNEEKEEGFDLSLTVKIRRE